IIDAIKYGPQPEGVSFGRFPEGSDRLVYLFPPSPFAQNSALWRGDIVINEIMYAPISRDARDQFIELYNRGTGSVQLAGWTFSCGIQFTFPTNAILAAGEYLVVARDVEHLKSSYPNLTAAKGFGNFGGSL